MNEPKKKKLPQLVVMLTANDLTVEDAEKVFESCKYTKAQIWGIKEKPLPAARMKALISRMKACGKTTVLEVVAYDEEGALNGAALAAQCGCDIMMGTMFHPRVRDFLHERGIKYMPFVGKIEGRPSVLRGEADDIVAEAQRVVAEGADGIDLLGYRYEGDAKALNARVVSHLSAPVCIAGSIDTTQRLDEVRAAKAWGFPVGSAFFEGKFGGTFAEQVNKVCDYIDHSHTEADA